MSDEKLILGIICLVIAIISFIGLVWGIDLYYAEAESLENLKEGPEIIGEGLKYNSSYQETVSEMENRIENTKLVIIFSAIIGIILLIIGILLLIKWNRHKKNNILSEYSKRTEQKVVGTK